MAAISSSPGSASAVLSHCRAHQQRGTGNPGGAGDIYRGQFPDLNLHQWTEAITTWFTCPLLDPTNSGRVVMDHLMKLVMAALEWTAARGETNVSAEFLQAAAEVLTLRQDAIQLIDGEPKEEGKQGLETEPGDAGTVSA